MKRHRNFLIVASVLKNIFELAFNWNVKYSDRKFSLNAPTLIYLILLQTLKHPNIVEILGVLQEPEISLVMEFVQHGSLQSYLTIYKESVSIKQMLKYALDIAKVCVKQKKTFSDYHLFRAWII